MIIALDGRPLLTRQIGGAQQHARNIVAQWAAVERPHQFLLLLDRNHGAPEQSDHAFVDALPAAFRPVHISGFHLFPRWFAASRMLNTLSWTLSRNEAAVYHSFTPMVPRTPVCPVVQTIHDLAYELDPAVRQRPESRDLRRITRLGAQWARRIIAVSSQTKNDIEAIYQVPPEKVSVVYNGLNPAFNPQPNASIRADLTRRFHLHRSYILAVGSDIPRRNYSRLLQAMLAVWQAQPDVPLLFAGRNPWPETAIYQQARAAGVAQHLLWVNDPSDEELAELYRGALLTCCASSFEGFGLSALESLACGTPVACSDMRSIREVAEEAAVYFPHDDPAAMGESILGLLEDVEYRRQLKYRGLGRAGLFTWRAAAEQVLTLLESIAGKPVPPMQVPS